MGMRVETSRDGKWDEWGVERERMRGATRGERVKK